MYCSQSVGKCSSITRYAHCFRALGVPAVRERQSEKADGLSCLRSNTHFLPSPSPPFALITWVDQRKWPCYQPLTSFSAYYICCVKIITGTQHGPAELFLDKTFGNQFASPIVFRIARQSNANVWHMTERPPSEDTRFGTTCTAWWKPGAAEHYVPFLRWGHSNRDPLRLSILLTFH